MMQRDCDLAIIGAGPTGLYAAYYAGFRGFSVCLIDALPELGGQITAMYPEKEIFDIAGFPAIRGRELVERLAAQADSAHPQYVLGERVVALEHRADDLLLSTDAGTSITARAVVITGGIGSFNPRALPVGEEFLGRGVVHFVPKLQALQGEDVVIVGGGDSAFDWAWSLHDIAASVTVVHRREEFRAHAATVSRVREAGVRLLVSTEIEAVIGEDRVRGVRVRHKETGETMELPATTIVAALGFVANIGPIADWGIALDKRRIAVNSAMFTNLERVLAAGDICTYPGRVPLIAVGFGEAAIAVNNAAPLIRASEGVFPGHSSGGAAE